MANDRLGAVVNLNNVAVTQREGFNFASLCHFGGTCLGANEDGVFTLNTADTDQYINAGSPGTNIDAFFELPTSDLGIPNQKRIRRWYVGYETNGNLLFEVAFDDGRTESYTLTPIKASDKQHGSRLPGTRTQRGRYIKHKVSNINGCDFAVDSIDMALVVLGKRPPGAR